MAIKTIFLDRDGVINNEINYLHKIDDFVFIDGIFDTCFYFNKIGFEIIIITNQSGIARGYFTTSQYEEVTSWMKSQFRKNNIKILDIYHCPHSSDSNCNCRKSKPGMLLEAKVKYNINMEKSWMIGDKETDITAAKSAGISNTILVKSGHKIIKHSSKAKFIFDTIANSKKVIK